MPTTAVEGRSQLVRTAAAAAVLTLLALPAVAAAQDLIIRRDGSLLSGPLVACVAGRCRIGHTDASFDDIAWIGLAQKKPDPPALTIGGGDVVVLRDGSEHRGQLVGVSLGVVELDNAELDRPTVAWIRLAAEIPAAPAPTPTPTVTPSGGNGALWTGTLSGHAFGTVDGIASDWSFDADVRLREHPSPLMCGGQRVGTFVRLEHEGTVVRNHFRSTLEGGSCSGEGTTTVSTTPGEQNVGHPSAIWIATVDRDLRACLGQGFDLRPGRGVYSFGVVTRSDQTFDVQCTFPGSEPQPYGFMPIGAGWYPILGAGECHDTAVRYLESGGGVMRGAYTTTCTGCCPRMEVRWSLCREGASCPPPAASDAPPAANGRR